MTSWEARKCNECGIVQDSLDKLQHWCTLYVIVDDSEIDMSPRLKLDFCSIGCRSTFMDRHHD